MTSERGRCQTASSPGTGRLGYVHRPAGDLGRLSPKTAESGEKVSPLIFQRKARRHWRNNPKTYQCSIKAQQYPIDAQIEFNLLTAPLAETMQRGDIGRQ